MKTSTSLVIAGTVCAVALFAFLGPNVQNSTQLFMKESKTTHPRETEFLEFVSSYRRQYGTKEEYRFRRDIFIKRL
jgi:hypothetical protein